VCGPGDWQAASASSTAAAAQRPARRMQGLAPVVKSFMKIAPPELIASAD
jgi:hypothetical protein